MEARLRVDGPLDVTRTLERYRRWGPDPATCVDAAGLRRVVRVDGRPHGYSVSWSGRARPTLVVRMARARAGRALDAAVAEVRRLCALDLDVAGFYGAAAADPVLRPLTERLHGFRPTLTPSPFEMLVGSICAQQVNLAWAFTTRARLVRRFGTPVRVDGHTVYAFPEPSRLARVRPDELRRLQFTTRKAEYIVGLARGIADGALPLDDLGRQDNDAVIDALTQVRGLGRWTAEWFLARGLGRGDVCPAGDLGVQKAFGHYYHRGRRPAEQAVRRRARAWGPHQNLAVHYLLAGHRLDTAGGG